MEGQKRYGFSVCSGLVLWWRGMTPVRLETVFSPLPANFCTYLTRCYIPETLMNKKRYNTKFWKPDTCVTCGIQNTPFVTTQIGHIWESIINNSLSINILENRKKKRRFRVVVKSIFCLILSITAILHCYFWLIADISAFFACAIFASNAPLPHSFTIKIV